MIYLDYAASTPMRDEALEAYVQTAKVAYANESSLHDAGTYAEDVLQACRQQLASSIHGKAEGVYFTNSGSEANILTVQSLLKGNKQKGKHIVTTEIEHASLHHLWKQLKAGGYEITYVDVNEEGLVTLDALKDVIREDTVLAAIHHGNPEIGVLQDIEEIGVYLAEKKVLFHIDAVQTYGERVIDVESAHIDSMAVSAHKLYGPKGCGFAYIRPEVRWLPVIEGATHERGFRPGTVDVPAIAAFAVASHHAFVEQVEREEHFRELREVLIRDLQNIPLCTIVAGKTENQLPQIVGMLISQMEGQYTLLECNRRGIAISTGSACQVNEQDPSRSMLALGYSHDEARQFIRISFGKDTTISDVKAFTKAIGEMTNNKKAALVED